jgi:hypothetical protein
VSVEVVLDTDSDCRLFRLPELDIVLLEGVTGQQGVSSPPIEIVLLEGATG